MFFHLFVFFPKDINLGVLKSIAMCVCVCVRVSDSLIVGGERRSVWPGEAVFGGGGGAESGKISDDLSQIPPRSRPDPVQNFGKVSHISVKCINDAFYTYM